MIICYNMFVKSNTPKFLDRTLDKFLQADRVCFLTMDDLRIFITEIESRLTKDRPVGSSYRVSHNERPFGEEGGQVTIERDDVPDMTMARFQYQHCKAVLRYSAGTDKFINVMYRVED